MTDERRLLAALIASYGVVLGSLLGKLSLWVDEILQLLGTRGTSIAEAFHWVTENPGASPLGYLSQWLFVNTLGFSLVSARLPAALFSVLSCVAVAWLARELQLRWVPMAVALFMTLPLQFRYGLEGRPYSQILFLSAVTTVLALRAAREPGLRWTALYALAVLAGLYSLPFLAFVPLAHLIWIVCCFRGSQRRGALVRVIAAAVLAGALFAPWYLYTRDSWRGIILANQWHFVFTAKTPLMLLREISGGGYWLSGLLVVASGLALASRAMSSSTKVLLVSITAVPMLGALAADAVFDYFLAARQMVFMLPGLVLLAVEGARTLEERRKFAGMSALAAMLAVALVYDSKWLSRPRENWQLPAARLKSLQAQCLVFIPEDSGRYYRFFEPTLPAAPCMEGRTALVIAPYALPDQVRAASRKLQDAGLFRTRSAAAGGTVIVTFDPAR